MNRRGFARSSYGLPTTVVAEGRHVKVDVTIRDAHLNVTLRQDAREVILRRWPWGADFPCREHSAREAGDYARRVAVVLGCRAEVATDVAIGVQVARLGLVTPNYDERRKLQRQQERHGD